MFYWNELKRGLLLLTYYNRLTTINQQTGQQAYGSGFGYREFIVFYYMSSYSLFSTGQNDRYTDMYNSNTLYSLQFDNLTPFWWWYPDMSHIS